MIELSDKVEEIRLQQVKEGNFYNCPKRFYANKVIVDWIDRCEGNKTGVSGIHVSMCCETCPVYYLNTELD